MTADDFMLAGIALALCVLGIGAAWLLGSLGASSDALTLLGVGS